MNAHVARERDGESDCPRDVQYHVSNTDAEKIADHMVDKLMARLSDEATVNAIMGVWTKQFDQHIGRTMRRGVWVLITAASIFVAVRFDTVMAFFKR